MQYTRAAANQAIMKGDTKTASTQLKLAELLLSMIELKSTGALNGTQASSAFMKVGAAEDPNAKAKSDNCIIDNEGKAECRYPR